MATIKIRWLRLKLGEYDKINKVSNDQTRGQMIILGVKWLKLGENDQIRCHMIKLGVKWSN